MHVSEITVREIEQLSSVFNDGGRLLRLPSITENSTRWSTARLMSVAVRGMTWL